MNNIDNPLSEYQPTSKEALINFGVNISREAVDKFAIENFGRTPKTQSERTHAMESKIMCELKENTHQAEQKRF